MIFELVQSNSRALVPELRLHYSMELSDGAAVAGAAVAGAAVPADAATVGAAVVAAGASSTSVFEANYYYKVHTENVPFLRVGCKVEDGRCWNEHIQKILTTITRSV